MKIVFRFLFLAVYLVSLVGCSGSSEDELQAWMQEQKNSARPRVPPLSEPKPYLPENYVPASSIEPFSKEKLLVALRKDSTPAASQTNALIAAELVRRKQALEAFPLDSMSMVGSVTQQGLPAALVKVENQLYTIKIGSYLGMNYGRVTKISETEIMLREVVQDSSGEWIERFATLQLQESVK